ncbi:Trypanosoma cruzi - metacyclin III [Trypanosoma rangeli]|uniref:Trypanosoma cruzi-metacyclin III n=1 Tax=Trypanosoma rangeli TaxID=5698 RepID=A0A3R7KQJ6_TRYRA|nr:Trypanosoma cruzi - metacyclin III [Trypanosoma rangeli]RNF07725.1 Trypanosoma cruzi - metacyclin III [Trypanosoma rangeli]|eukprot:RNF07725.1 Trypanosoma cruzi - metacyclin III [Trypanosoma rangeli]
MSRRRDPKSHLTEFIHKLRDQGNEGTTEAPGARGEGGTSEGRGRYAPSFSGQVVLANAPTRGRSFPPRPRPDTSDDSAARADAGVTLLPARGARGQRQEAQHQHFEEVVEGVQEYVQERQRHPVGNFIHDAHGTRSSAAVHHSTSSGIRARGGSEPNLGHARRPVAAGHGRGRGNDRGAMGRQKHERAEER